MNRRGFIRGMLMSATAGTALVRLANAEETHALAVNEPIALGTIAPDWQIPSLTSPEIFVRQRGVFVCVGLIKEIRITQELDNVISWDGETVLVPGLKRGEMLFSGSNR